MISLNIDKLLKEQGKTRYWLATETGLRYQTIMKLANGETKSISFEVLEQLVLALNTTFDNLIALSNK